MSFRLRADHVALSIRSLSRSFEFYVGLLGGTRVSAPSETFAEVMLGDACIHLLPIAKAAEAANDHPHAHHVAFGLDTLAELTALRDALNASPLVAEYAPFAIVASPPQGEGATHVERRPPVATMYFRDPDGVRLEARCYRA
jgi:catechol 2,3-dioxygenase-like lactoylglutathione lyase family enzyme